MNSDERTRQVALATSFEFLGVDELSKSKTPQKKLLKKIDLCRSTHIFYIIYCWLLISARVEYHISCNGGIKPSMYPHSNIPIIKGISGTEFVSP